jgi:formamidopyrimidine-DNA glycosylase
MELPEAKVIAQQINETIKGKKIMNVVAACSPHKFAWYHKDPQAYHDLLSEKTIDGAVNQGGMLEIKVQDAVMLFCEGIGIRYHHVNEERPKKHQLLVEFDDFSAISISIQMYGGIMCFKEGEIDNPYYETAKQKPSPFIDLFSWDYFNQLISADEVQKLSAKAFLATEQRIPGLGNGVLQDVLFNAKIHPKKKIATFSDLEKNETFHSIKVTLTEMMFQGGRDTEKDLFGCAGGYKTKQSKNTVNEPCIVCGSLNKKESYMGGSIYFCENCQVYKK